MGISFDFNGLKSRVSLPSVAIDLSRLIQEVMIFPVAYGYDDRFGTLAIHEDEDHFTVLAGIYISEYSTAVPRITWWRRSTLLAMNSSLPSSHRELTVHGTELALYLAALAFFLAGDQGVSGHQEWWRDRFRLKPNPDWTVFDESYVWTDKARAEYDQQRATT